MGAAVNGRPVAVADARARRIEARAEAGVRTQAAETDARIREADAAAARRMRQARERLRLDAERAAAKRAQRDADDLRKREARHARRQLWQRRHAAIRGALGAAVEHARHNAPGVYSAVIYGMAVAVAVGGQITVATSRGYPTLAGVGMAVFVEGLALSMALTALQQRLRGERALTARALTWAAALFAAGVNYAAHAGDPVLAVLLAASSLAGITVWEVRSGARHREALRAAGMIPAPSSKARAA